MPSERPHQRWTDIADNCRRIRTYTEDIDEAAFLASDMMRDAVERCLERIAEAARKLGDAYDADFPDADLPALRRFGSVLRHDYDGINPQALWRFVVGRVPVLARAAEVVLAGIGETED